MLGGNNEWENIHQYAYLNDSVNDRNFTPLSQNKKKENILVSKEFDQHYQNKCLTLYLTDEGNWKMPSN